MRNAAAGDWKSKVIKSGAQSASYMWSFKFFRAHFTLLNMIFAGPLKENEQRKKWPNRLGSLRIYSLPFFQNEEKN